MAKDSFLLVSLKEGRAKKLANVISNESCRKILEFLSENDAAESEIAHKLGIPMPTVHYNLKILAEAGLVKAEEFHYSKKGREVNHYSLTNKFIIIAPESTYGLRAKLKAILPVMILVGIFGSVLEFFKGTFFGGKAAVFGAARETVFQGAAKSMAVPLADEAAVVAMDAFEHETAGAAVEALSPVIQPVIPHIGLWFIFGAAAALGLYLLAEYIIKRKTAL